MTPRKIQNRIKPPRSAFCQWKDAHRPDLAREHPGKTNWKLSMIALDIWRGLSEEEKRPWYDLEKKERTRIREKYGQVHNKVRIGADPGTSQLRENKRKSGNRGSGRAQAVVKQEVEPSSSKSSSQSTSKTSKSKVPPQKKSEVKVKFNAFFSWFNANRAMLKRENPGKKQSELTSIAGSIWRAMSHVEKKRWINFFDEKDVACRRSDLPERPLSGPKQSASRTKRKMQKRRRRDRSSSVSPPTSNTTEHSALPPPQENYRIGSFFSKLIKSVFYFKWF